MAFLIINRKSRSGKAILLWGRLRSLLVGLSWKVSGAALGRPLEAYPPYNSNIPEPPCRRFSAVLSLHLPAACLWMLSMQNHPETHTQNEGHIKSHQVTESRRGSISCSLPTGSGPRGSAESPHPASDPVSRTEHGAGWVLDPKKVHVPHSLPEPQGWPPHEAALVPRSAAR